MWTRNKQDKWLDEQCHEAHYPTEADWKIIRDEHEWNIWRILEMEAKDGLYEYISKFEHLDSYLRLSIYMNIKLHKFHALWESKVCENCEKTQYTILRFRNPCGLCGAPFDFKIKDMEVLINGIM